MSRNGGAARKDSSRSALLVMGMHRSGTSALARVLSLRGADLPEKLVQPNHGNETGYWEPRSVVDLNDRMLDFFGVSWDDPFAAYQLPDPKAFPARFRKQALAILESEYGDCDLFVLKDPRCTLLHGFWREVLGSASIRECPIVIARPFDEVADSLLRRDSTGVASSVLLYVAYGLEAASAVAGGASIITYRQLTNDWLASTDRIAREQKLTWPRTDARMQAEIDEFLSLSPRPGRRLRIPGELRSWAAAVWSWLSERSEGRHVELSELDPVRQELARAMDLFSPLIADRNRQAKKLEAAISQEQTQVQRVSQTLDESNALLHRTAEERDTALAERDRALKVYQDTDAHLSASRERLLELEATLARVGEESRDRDREHQALLDQANAVLRKTAEERDTALAERDRALKVYQDTDAHLSASRERQLELEATLAKAGEESRDRDREHQAQLDQANAALRKTAEERDTALAERDEALKIYRETDEHLNATRTLLAQMDQELGAARQQLDELGHQKQELEAMQAAMEGVLARVTTLEAEKDHALLERDDIARTCSDLEARLEDARGESDQLEHRLLDALAQVASAADERGRLMLTYRETDDLLHRTEEQYQALDREHARLRAELLRAERETVALKDMLAAVHSSHSWRVTAPLRAASRVGRRLVGGTRKSTQLLLPGPPAAPDAVPNGPVGQPPRIERLHREHAGLRQFLRAEFGERTTNDVLSRIDDYRLPIDTDSVRSAARAECSEAEAFEWIGKIAERAAGSGARDRDPDVSIVVPVYNQLPFTLACLDALLAHESRYSFEILVGDDASTDATESVFAVPIDRVRYVRHRGNLGFVRNCNATAEAARGRYVVFLNNDTQVLPNWLDELIGTLDSDVSVGLAGSKLIFPDGRMQECGAIVWQDGSAWNFGRLDDPRKPEYCYQRDVDFVSGASIALRRDTWKLLGGFDELFVPAYAEDADLAFRVRARGLRTVVQPLSQLLHFEGVSSGTDLGSGAKAYQVGNLKKLHDRWRSVLDGHRPNAQEPAMEKERAVAKRLLFIDMVTPTPNEDAGSLVAFEMMEAFRSKGFKVTFIPADNFAHMGATTSDLQRIGIETIYHPSYSSMDDFLRERNDAFDVILLVRFQVGEAHMAALRKRYPGAKIIFSNCDLHYLREMREAELTNDPEAISAAAETKRRELGVIASCDLNLVHSEAELQLLQSDAPEAPCVLFPLVHDPVEVCAPLSKRDGACFVGGYRHAPNADGIVWFVDKVWPKVVARDSSHVLYIAGSSMTPEVEALASRPNVQVVGFVEDLEGFLAKRRVALAPLRFGAGAKGKVAVSLANGVPVVSTPVGTEGMQLESGLNVLVAESEQELADAVLKVLADDECWHALSHAGLRYAEEVTSRSSARKRVESILERLGIQA